jgi:membrane-associated phospholipid phosphatase
MRLLLLVLLLAPAPGRAAETREYGPYKMAYEKPGFWRTLGNGPSDWGRFVKWGFARERLSWLAAVGASTALLVKYDQEIYEETRRAGRRLGISSEDKTKTYLTVNGLSLFRGPGDLGSALYFLGDGWVNIGLFGYFEISGRLKDDWRELQTGHQLAEGLLVTGFTTQLLKRATGRETPRAATKAGGKWSMFPPFAEYQAHRSGYDAFPSGHVATSMMTVTIIAENYPEKTWVKPLGYTLVGLLSFQMVNNGVHWASDYPLGLAIGYGVGKAIATDGRGAAKRGVAPAASAVRLTPWLSPEGAGGLALAYRY